MIRSGLINVPLKESPDASAMKLAETAAGYKARPESLFISCRECNGTGLHRTGYPLGYNEEMPCASCLGTGSKRIK